MLKKLVVLNFIIIIIIIVGNNESLTFDIKTMSRDLKGFLSNLVESLLGKLPDPSNKHT